MLNLQKVSKVRKKLIFLAILSTLAMYVAPASALSPTGHIYYSDPTNDVYTEYCTDDGYMSMRDLTGLIVDWNSTMLSITISVSELINTTAAWNNTGYTITISYTGGGQEWWPQWSSTHFNTTTAADALWEYCILVQNITADSGTKYCYIVDTSYTYTEFSTLGVTVDFPSANNITVYIPWDAIGGFESYGDEFYICAGSFYCYAYGTQATGDILTKFLDHISPSNEKTIIVHPDWGSDPEGYPKYEVIIGDFYVVPEFSMLMLLALIIAGSSVLVAAKKYKK